MRTHTTSPTRTSVASLPLLAGLAALALPACASRQQAALPYPTTTEQVAANTSIEKALNAHASESTYHDTGSGPNLAREMQQLAIQGDARALPGSDPASSPAYRPATGTLEGLDSATFNISQVTFADEGAIFDPCLSKDGQTLFYSTTLHASSSDIYAQRAGSRVMKQLTRDPAQDMMPALSPDGSQIAFASDRNGNWDVFVMPVSGGKAVQVTNDPAHEIAPSWSPDGSTIAYSRLGGNTGRWEMWTLPVSNPNTASFIGFGLFPKFNPIVASGPNQGDVLIYQLGRERGRRSYGIWTMELVAGEAQSPTQMASAADRALINPTWSPDGKWIAFSEVMLPPDAPASVDAQGVFQSPQVGIRQSALRLMNADGEGDMRVTFANQLAVAPAWAFGNRLYFVSNQNGFENVWSLDMTSPVRTAMASKGMSDMAIAAGLASLTGGQTTFARTPASKAPKAALAVSIDVSSDENANADEMGDEEIAQANDEE